MNTELNRKIVLAERPKGAPTEKHFRLEKVTVPNIGQGQLLLKSIYLSLDPYMRSRMDDGESYAKPMAIGETMVGGTVSQVVKSKHPNFKQGEWVLSFNGWQDYAISDGSDLQSLGMDPKNPSYALGIMGMPGFTAYIGLQQIGQLKAGETLVVAAATGPVGATVGQIARIKGARTVAIVGDEKKREYAINELGFDIALNRRNKDFAAQLKAACPDGIDVYFENVGGEVFEAVLPLLNNYARVPLCGLVSQYNLEQAADGAIHSQALISQLLTKRIHLQGFIISDYYQDYYQEFLTQMNQWIAEGKITYLEQKVDGLENAPEALMGLLQGHNFGKVVVQTNQPLAA